MASVSKNVYLRHKITRWGPVKKFQKKFPEENRSVRNGNGTATCYLYSSENNLDFCNTLALTPNTLIQVPLRLHSILIHCRSIPYLSTLPSYTQSQYNSDVYPNFLLCRTVAYLKQSLLTQLGFHGLEVFEYIQGHQHPHLIN